MKPVIPTILVSWLLLVAAWSESLAAEDATIDRLLSKLPPPEKLVKAPVQQAVQLSDPATRDPLVKQILQGEFARNFPQALNLSRKLTERYPRSAAAYSIRGALAWRIRQFGEASASFHTAISIAPRLALPHFGLALVEATQGHFAAAIPHLQRVAELEPKAAVTYYALSDCTLRLGRKQESVDYARKATTLAPSNAYMWIQLAKSEKALGHTEATFNAILKAAEVSPDNGLMLAVVGFSYINLGRIPQAIPPLERAARLMPRNYLVQSQLGYCLEAVGQVDREFDSMFRIMLDIDVDHHR